MEGQSKEEREGKEINGKIGEDKDCGKIYLTLTLKNFKSSVNFSLRNTHELQWRLKRLVDA